MRAHILVAIAVALLPTAAQAQEMTRKDFHDFCEVLQGRWLGKLTPVVDDGAFGKRGESLAAFASATLSEDGNALLAKVYAGKGTGTWLIAHDACDKKIRTMWINSAGDVDQALIIREGDEWIERGQGSSAKGEVIKFENRLTISNGGKTHTWTGTSSRGAAAGQPRHDVWQRVSGKVPAAEGSDDFQAFANMAVGRWNGDVVYIHDWEGEEVGKGGRVTGYADFRLIADGKAVLLTDYAGSSQATHLIVWEPTIHRIVATGVGSDGMTARSIVDRVSERAWKFQPIAGGTIHGEPLGGSATCTFSEDGKTYRWSGTLRLSGKPLDELQDVYHRVP